MMITQRYVLDLVPGKPQPVVNVSQYDDNSRDIEFEVYNDAELFDIPDDAIVTCDGTKPDKNFFSFDCAHEGNVVTVKIKKQMSVVNGPVTCQLTILPGDGSAALGSANFTIAVEKAPVKTDDMSETQIESLSQVLQDTIATKKETGAIRDEVNATAEKFSKMIKNPVGYFADAENLKAAFPSAELYDWAVVGEDGTIWRWNDDTKQWYNGGGQLQAKVFVRKIILETAKWYSAQQTVTVDGISADEDKQLILAFPALNDRTVYNASEINAIDQSTNAITFQHDSEDPPSVDIQVYLYVQEIFT